MKTEIIRVDPLSFRDEELAPAIEYLKAGEVVGIPTETVYGLGADARNPEAVRKIFAAKGRPCDNPLIVHICDLKMLPPLVREIPPEAYPLMERFWPGPMTIIFKKSDLIPSETSGGLDTVGIRFPVNPVAQAVIRLSGMPIAAPSANLSGRPSPTRASHVIEDMDGRVPCIIDGGPSAFGVESTVLTLAEGMPRILRPGSVTKEMLEEVSGSVIIDHGVLEQIGEGEKVLSPGMKYKHYSPKANVIILKGTAEQYRRYLETADKDGAYALCYEEDFEGCPIPVLSFGKLSDEQTQSAALFDSLREADEKGARTVYARCPSTDGVGLAIYNRLIRAAGFDIIELAD